jgi:hypothetical protein
MATMTGDEEERFGAKPPMVPVDENNRPIGEAHHRAKLTDAEVDLIRELREPSDGAKPLGVREIAQKFEVAPSTVSDIVNYLKRATTPVGWRRARVMPKAAVRVMKPEADND